MDNILYPREHMSISSLQLFDNCPFSFMMRYMLDVKLPQTPKQKLGDQFQKALNLRYSGQDPTPKIQEMEPKMRGIATLLMNKSFDFDGIVSLDKEYKVDLGFDVPMMFIPDILTDSAIIENKFTTGYYNPKMVLKERQRIVYYVGVRRLFGFNPKVYYQLFNTSKKSVELIETPTDLNDIDQLMIWIEKTLRQIQRCMQTGDWTSGSNHSWCSYPISCPLQARLGNKNKFK